MKIAVGMSGGVDSSVAAYILKQEGHQVIGVTMRHFDNRKFGFSSDDGIEKAIKDAKKVCEKLNIPHYVIDVKEQFEKTVIENFISEYKKGRTPNPCTLCNKTIKWGAFAKEVIKRFSVDKIATGHYVKIKIINGDPHIYKSYDLTKDQTYMLWELSKEQLSKTLFPLSGYKKDEIRKIAQEIGLDIAKKKDSQEVCFIKGHYSDFFIKHFNIKQGDIKYKTGEVIGKHKGAVFYTIGQRKGLNTPWKSALYVYKIDIGKNEIYVTDDKNDLLADHFEISDANWLYFPNDLQDVFVMIRYNSKPEKVKNIIKKDDGNYSITLENPKRAVTRGQSAVFYKNDELIGGGIIETD